VIIICWKEKGKAGPRNRVSKIRRSRKSNKGKSIPWNSGLQKIVGGKKKKMKKKNHKVDEFHHLRTLCKKKVQFKTAQEIQVQGDKERDNPFGNSAAGKNK